MPKCLVKSAPDLTKPIIINASGPREIDLSDFSQNNIVLKLNAGAKLNLKQTSGQLNNVLIEMEKASALNYFIKCEYQRDIKNSSITVKLNGRSASANLYMAIIGRADGKANIDIRLEHQNSNTKGLVQIRRLQYDSSQSLVNGLLFIGSAGGGADTYLSDKSLLIGARCQALSKPQLEIQTNNVKASHGAAVGYLRTEDLFYLQSRGLSKSTAMAYLSKAFISPVLPKIE